jgi:hypothetical protein
VTANAEAVVGVADLAVVRPQDLDPDPAPNPVPDPPQKGNPEVVPGPNQKGTVVAVQNREDKIRATGASEMEGGQIVPPDFAKIENQRETIYFCLYPQFLDLTPFLQG